MDKSKRLYILSEKEVKEIYSIPNFYQEEQDEHFSLNNLERKLAFSHNSISSIIYFILQFGYFKVKKNSLLFFSRM